MQKIVSEDGALVLQSTEYTQHLIRETYGKVCIHAVMFGFDKAKAAWREDIADIILGDVVLRSKPEAIALVQETGVAKWNSREAFEKAAELVISSRK